jgi:hypothetical protein
VVGLFIHITLLASVSDEYAEEVKGPIASAQMLVLSALSVPIFLGLMVLAVINTDRDLRENDPALHCKY